MRREIAFLPSEDEERLLSAIRRTTAAIQAYQRGPAGQLEVILESTARVVRASGSESVARLKLSIKNSKLWPVDPLDLDWDVFKLFGVEATETAWTQWLAGILSPENGPELSNTAWMSLCDAVISGPGAIAVSSQEAEVLATVDHWRASIHDMLQDKSVVAEYEAEEFERPDLVIYAPKLIVVVENKLAGGWHDSPGRKSQADRYRDFGLELTRQNSGKALALVLLTNWDDGVAGKDFPQDYVHVRYYDLGRFLRKHLRRRLGPEPSPTRIVKLWPLFLTLTAIERHLLGLESGVPDGGLELGWQSIDKAVRTAKYIEGG